MSERFKIEDNEHDSKNTRLPIATEFSHYRYGRDALAHVSRYLYVIETAIQMSKRLKRPITWLDIGCGDIYLARTFISSYKIKKTDIVKNYTGLDIDEKRLEKTRQTLPASMDITLVQGDITKDTLEQFDKFDLVTCLEVLEHIKPEFVPKVLRQISKISTLAMISTPNITGGTGSIPADHIKEWDTDELKETMENNNFTVHKRIGIFSNLNQVKKLAEKNQLIKWAYDTLKESMDANFLSITMGRLIGKHAQNVLYLCTPLHNIAQKKEVINGKEKPSGKGEATTQNI